VVVVSGGGGWENGELSGCRDGSIDLQGRQGSRTKQFFTNLITFFCIFMLLGFAQRSVCGRDWCFSQRRLDV
jgi:hypothetical protein